MASAMLVDVWLLAGTPVSVFFLFDCCGISRAWICVCSFARCARARAAVTLWGRRWCVGFWEAEPRTGEWDEDVVMLSPFQHMNSSTLHCLYNAQAHARMASSHAARSTSLR